MTSKQIFFITGYPRSRTAWLATLFTWGNCFCFHDGLANIESLDELDEKFASVPGDIVGNSDPANLLFHSELRERYPEARWIVVERNFNDAREASQSAFGWQNANLDWLDLSIRLAVVNGLRVGFESLCELRVLNQLVHYIGISMPVQRIQELMRLNIQVKPDLLRNIPDSTVKKMAKLHECILA